MNTTTPLSEAQAMDISISEPPAIDTPISEPPAMDTPISEPPAMDTSLDISTDLFKRLCDKCGVDFTNKCSLDQHKRTKNVCEIIVDI